MPRPKPPKRMTKAAIEAAALAYLARFATSSANLRRVLQRKVGLSAAYHGDEAAPLLAEIELLVARFTQKRILDDGLYAEMQRATLRRRGGSARAIGARLAAKGVPSETIAEALAGGDDAGADHAAAVRLARRRRLGPFRQANRAEYRQRDLAALGRAGFDYQTAVAVIDAAPGTIDRS